MNVKEVEADQEAAVQQRIERYLDVAVPAIVAKATKRQSKGKSFEGMVKLPRWMRKHHRLYRWIIAEVQKRVGPNITANTNPLLVGMFNGIKLTVELPRP